MRRSEKADFELNPRCLGYGGSQETAGFLKPQRALGNHYVYDEHDLK